MALPRIHLFEFEDLKWMPKIFRRFITDLLAYQINHFGIYDATTDKLAETLLKTGHSTIVDLCSGSGGPALAVRKKISKIMKHDVRLVLTDKYPNLNAFAAIDDEHVATIPTPVDALHVPPKLKLEGLRTLFTAFHHFKPDNAKRILKNAVEAKMPIGIFEITERKLSSLMTLLVAPITCLVFSIAIRPFKLSRFFWTYIVPVIPILYTWDGLVSNMRTYTKREWLEMTEQFQNAFIWESGELISKFHIKVNYLIGLPKSILHIERTKKVGDENTVEDEALLKNCGR